jgi:transposase
MATQGNSLLLRELVLKTLEREVRELRRANEILKSAAAFFGAELDRRPSR